MTKKMKRGDIFFDPKLNDIIIRIRRREVRMWEEWHEFLAYNTTQGCAMSLLMGTGAAKLKRMIYIGNIYRDKNGKP